MTKARAIKVETTRRACGTVAGWLLDSYVGPAPTLLTEGDDSTERLALCRVLSRASRRAGPADLVLALDRAGAAWLGARAPSAAVRAPVLGGMFAVDVGPLAQAPRAVRDLAERCAAALRVRRGGHNAHTRDRRREEIDYFAETRGSHKQSVSDQRARVWRRRDRRDAWLDRLHDRGETLLTSTEAPPT